MENLAASETNDKKRKVIAIMSGKGGVGKSLVTALLAATLQRRGLQVGVLDGDLTSPALVKMFGATISLSINEHGAIEPLTSKSGVKLLSMNVFQENESDPIVWRGPMLSSAFKQFYSDIDWGQLDYLIVDVPTGTSDIPMTVLHSLPLDGIVLVSSPQKLASSVTKRCIAMIQQMNGPITGIVENMSFFLPPDGEYYEIFGPSSSDELTTMTNAPLLAQLPLDPKLTAFCDAGQIEEYHTEIVDNFVTHFVDVIEL